MRKNTVKRKLLSSMLLMSMSIGSFLGNSTGLVNIQAAENNTIGYVYHNDFDYHDSDSMHFADGWSNGSMFDCTWREDNVSFNNGIMSLSIRNDIPESTTQWSGAEYRTNDFFHYGMYETRMKAIKNDGVVTSLFTYTGPSDDNPWDEIDIEILGKDTTKVQFNYFTNGVGDHEYVYDLGFDASADFHIYGFLWLPDSITWYIDGNPVYTATSNIPSTPSRIMMNVWPGTGVDDWLNPFNGVVPLTAEYDYLRYTEYDHGSSKSNNFSWSTDAGWGQYMLEDTGNSIIVYRYGEQQRDEYAHLIGALDHPVNSPKMFKLKLNFIDGNKLALTVKTRDTNMQETEVGHALLETYQKGIHEIEIPIYGVNTDVHQIILMINSNPYQIDLSQDAFCKVELLSAELTY